MSIELRFRRGTTAQHSTFTGAQAEVTVDTTANSLVVHDGVTAGGHPIAPSSVVATKVDQNLSAYTDAGALDGTETTFVNKSGSKRTTVQKVLDWIKTQAITWTAKQTISGDLEFSGTARRILGDFGSGTAANRPFFQASVLNDGTYVGALPNGTSTGSGFYAANTSDPANHSYVGVFPSATEGRVISFANGTGAILPLTFYTSGALRSRITVAGNVEHINFTKLGESSPAIKVKKLTGTTAATEGGVASISHGVTRAKILGVQVIVDNTWGEASAFAEVYFSWSLSDTNIDIKNHDTNSGSILSKAVRVLVTYEE